jgi:hypothetical protein
MHLSDNEAYALREACALGEACLIRIGAFTAFPSAIIGISFGQQTATAGNFGYFCDHSSVLGCKFGPPCRSKKDREVCRLKRASQLRNAEKSQYGVTNIGIRAGQSPRYNEL